MKKTAIIIFLLAIILTGCKAKEEKPVVVTIDEAKQKTLDFINKYFMRSGETASISEAVEEPKYNMYKFTVLLPSGETTTSYASKDGKEFMPQVINFQEVEDSQAKTQDGQAPAAADTTVPKSDKPVAELFVMTHCPYGTQAEKGFIPAIKAIGDKADVKIRFVHYFMHDPENTETPRQVCIREEQGDKYLAYLECFLEGDGKSANAGNDPSVCMKKAGVNESKVNECVSSGKSKEYYDQDSELSKKAGVTGSPTLVINGQKAQGGRDSASYLKAICNAFNNQPDECSKELSSASPAAGFGTGAATGGAAAGSCN